MVSWLWKSCFKVDWIIQSLCLPVIEMSRTETESSYLAYLWITTKIGSAEITVDFTHILASRDKCPGSLCHGPTVSVRVGVCAWTKTLTLAITFLPLKIELSYFICVFLMTRPFTWYHNFLPCDLDLELWPFFFKNFNLGHNFQTRRDRIFLLHMCIPCDKTFHMVP